MPQKTTAEPKQEQQNVPPKPNVAATSILFLLTIVLSIIVLMGVPLFGSPWISLVLLAAILISTWILLLSSSARARPLSDLHMIAADDQHRAVREVMDVRIALEEESIRTYRGRLAGESQETFDYLSQELRNEDALTFLEPDTKLGAVISVVPRSRRTDLVSRKVNWPLHTLLFFLTLVTTTFAGAAYLGVNVFSTPERLLWGIPYSLAIMTALGLHEAGHYFVARRYRINVTPPYFLPAPFPLGTFGAFISMRSPSRNRQVMFDTAVAGPLIGLLVSVVILFVGLSLSEAGPQILKNELLSPRVGDSVLFTLVATIANPSLSFHESLTLHPLAFAGWLGLLITAVNLIPAGQLDGGHVAQALFGPGGGRLISSVATFSLLALALFVWPGLLLFALFVLLIAGGTDRPLDNMTALNKPRKLLGGVVFLCLLAILIPMPEVAYRWLVGLV